MKKKVPLFVLVLACVLSMLLGGLIAFGAFRHAVGPGGMSLLKEQSIIENRFVGDYDPDQVRQAAEKAMIDALGDRWSYYLTPEELQAAMSTRENNYVGIGVTIEDDEKGLLITQVTPESPAAKAGLQPGEIICAVDGTPVTPANRDESVDRVRGEAGTVVLLDILDEEDSFIDGTSAMMAAAAAYRGILGGWIGKEHLAAADLACDTVSGKIDGMGLVREVCGCPHFEEEGTSAEAQAAWIMADSWRRKAVHAS